MTLNPNLLSLARLFCLDDLKYVDKSRIGHARVDLVSNSGCRSFLSNLQGFPNIRLEQPNCLLPCRVYFRRGFAFFLEHYVLKAEAEVLVNRRAKENWECSIPIAGPTLRGDTVILVPLEFSRLRCLSVSVWNKSGFEIEDAEVEVNVFLGQGFLYGVKHALFYQWLKPDITGSISWHEKRKQVEIRTVGKDYNFVPELLSSKQIWQTREINIKPFKSALVDILFTVEGREQAYLTDDDATPLPVGREYKAWLTVYGSNIHRPNFTRVHIQLRAWNEISCSYDTVWNAFLRWLARNWKKKSFSL
jgi:hypothetical protein